MVAVVSDSAQVSRTRPFYALHAEAYDLLVTDPVEPWVDEVHRRLTARGWSAAVVLDAGCGTGRHAAALSAMGHRVDLADASAELLAQAAARTPGAQSLHVDLCALDVGTEYQAVTCRGVLNDMITDVERDAVLRSFAGVLAPGGLLLLDVREQEGSRRRADAVARRRAVDLGERRRLELATTAVWWQGLLLVHEEYTVLAPAAPADRSVFEFTMRPWTEQELRDRLIAAGFCSVGIGPGIGRSTTDRLFVVAER